MVAFRVFGVRCLWFPLAIFASRPCKGLVVVPPIWVGGSNRVSSSRGAGLFLGALVVFVCFICGCIFGSCFLNFGWVVLFRVLHKKHVLPLACSFSTDFLAPSFFQCVFFGLVFHTFG